MAGGRGYGAAVIDEPRRRTTIGGRSPRIVLPAEGLDSAPGTRKAEAERPYPAMLQDGSTRPGAAAVSAAVAVLLLAVWLVGCAVLLFVDRLLVVGFDPFADPLPDPAPHPVDLAAFCVALASWGPLAHVAFWAGYARSGWPTRWLASVDGRIRWAWLARCVALSLAGCVAVSAVAVGTVGGRPLPEPRVWAAVGLAGVPLAAAGTALARGWLTLWAGSWLASSRAAVVSGVVVPAVLACFPLLAMRSPAGAVVAVAGLASGWLIVRTGGLEATFAVDLAVFTTWLVLFVLRGGAGTVAIHAARAEVTLSALPGVAALSLGLPALLASAAARRGTTRLYHAATETA